MPRPKASTSEKATMSEKKRSEAAKFRAYQKKIEEDKNPVYYTKVPKGKYIVGEGGKFDDFFSKRELDRILAHRGELPKKPKAKKPMKAKK